MDLQIVEVELCKWLLSSNYVHIPDEKAKISNKSLSNIKLKRFSLENLSALLQVDKLNDRQLSTDIKLRLALHLAPKDAIQWDPTRTESRVEVIQNYLISNFEIKKDAAGDLSRIVVKTLKNWESTRRNVRDTLDEILQMQQFKCATCNILLTDEYREELGDKVRSGDRLDIFKPIYDAVNDYFHLEPEVDHIEPVSGFGLNHRENLQVLCRLCNFGKGDGLSFSLINEYKNCHKPLNEIKWGHRAKMFYYRLEMDNFECTVCGTTDMELTVRPTHRDSAFLLTTLATMCTSCADDFDSETYSHNLK